MRFSRLTTSRLMLLVAILALPLAAVTLAHRRSAYYRLQAERYSAAWLVYSRVDGESGERSATYHLDMASQYRRLAASPWLWHRSDP